MTDHTVTGVRVMVHEVSLGIRILSHVGQQANGAEVDMGHAPERVCQVPSVALAVLVVLLQNVVITSDRANKVLFPVRHVRSYCFSIGFTPEKRQENESPALVL